MKRTITGLLVAVVAVVTSLIVVLRTEKPRSYLQARFEQVRSALPGQEQVRQQIAHIALRVSHLANGAKGTTEQAITKVKKTGSDLAEKAQKLTAVGSRNGR